MASPTLTNITSTTTGATTAVSATVPAGVTSGAGVLIVVFTNSTSTITGFGTTGLAHAPGSPLPSSGGQYNINVLTKRATGADSGTYALTQSAAGFWTAGGGLIGNLVAAGAIWDTNSGTGAARAQVTGQSVNTSMTTQVADELLINIGGQFNGGTWTQPTGFTKDFTDSAAPGVLYFGHLAQAVAGATGTLTASCTGASSQMAGWLGAIVGTTGGATTINGTASLAGAGVLTPPASTLIAGAALAGAGAVSPVMSILLSSAALAGAGVLTPPASILRAPAVLVGNGSVALVPSALLAGASLTGAGVLVANAGGTTTGTAALVGQGALTASATLRAGAALAGAGVMSPVMSILRAGAALVGAGVLTAAQAGSIHVTVWTGAAEIPTHGIAVWNGASEIPAVFASVV